MADWKYDGLRYRRRPTRVVHVGDVAVGGDYPIRVQSMTTPSTTDTQATAEQIARLVEAGCEIVRLTVPTSADADNLPNIRAELERRRIRVPLVADIHFTPRAAMKAVEHVDKIRINPGNFADKKKFAVREYSEKQYALELARIETVFAPLVQRAKQRGVSMRIGTNHGSLSDRIMNRYGDTPEGMVESALEFVRICEAHDYHELILSMKSSNPVVVQQAYRLLVDRMAREKMHYPLHLGVTEAGDGEDGRVKSAMGIGALLDEGIGDTVRVSLTEDPVAEIPVARALVESYNLRNLQAETPPLDGGASIEGRDPFTYSKRESNEVTVGAHTLGGDHPVLVELALTGTARDEAGVRRQIDASAGVRVPEEARVEVVSLDLSAATERRELARLHAALRLVAPRVALSARIDPAWLEAPAEGRSDPWLDAVDRLHLTVKAPWNPFLAKALAALLAQARASSKSVLIEAASSEGEMGQAVDTALALARLEPGDEGSVLALALAPSPRFSPLHAYRLLAARLDAENRRNPIVLLDDPVRRGCDPLLGPAAALGGLLCDGIGDAIQLASNATDDPRRLAFGILQAARVRITRTEFISCPSCGRTLFDLEETTARIKARTAHLKGLKIAVMGCVVNGPGEMADADFGYVGWGEDKIALFVGKEMVARDIPTDTADQRLVELIKERGRWVEPPVVAVEEV
jgi:(E)-4-hydroxy-3-methylbut-2-enyl-diphosphate synthase